MFRSGGFPQPVRTVLPLNAADHPTAARSVEDAHGNRYAIGENGLTLCHPGGKMQLLVPSDRLPVREVLCLTRSPEGDLWLGTSRGAVRWLAGRTEYYASKRWLPHDRVEAIACFPDNSVWLWTPEGISRLEYREMALEEKAAHYEQLTDTRHKRFGFVTGCQLHEAGDLTRTQHHIDDNDGLWTGMYVAAEAFRFAVTGEDEARRKAQESLLAIVELERKSGVDGFCARALTHSSEPQYGNHPDGEWHAAADEEWEWKGDTSSDEMDGHYFAWAIYYDLVADEDERAMLRALVGRVTDFLIDNDYYLIDVDGKPTTWGVWAPDALNHDPRWRAERGLNSLEMLSYLRVAHHITGEPKYEIAYSDLVEDHHYALNTIEQKALPGDFPGAEDNHSDDELAFLAYYGLLKYEADPGLRAVYTASIERSWQVERPEKCPLWNVIYGAVTGRSCDVEGAVRSLEEIPLDLIRWRVTNSHRQDITTDPAGGRHGERQARTPVPWSERPVHKWNGNPYSLDGGDDFTEECGTFWLLPYWMGRYHGIILQGAEERDQ